MSSKTTKKPGRSTRTRKPHKDTSGAKSAKADAKAEPQREWHGPSHESMAYVLSEDVMSEFDYNPKLFPWCALTAAEHKKLRKFLDARRDDRGRLEHQIWEYAEMLFAKVAKRVDHNELMNRAAKKHRAYTGKETTLVMFDSAGSIATRGDDGLFQVWKIKPTAGGKMALRHDRRYDDPQRERAVNQS